MQTELEYTWRFPESLYEPLIWDSEEVYSIFSASTSLTETTSKSSRWSLLQCPVKYIKERAIEQNQDCVLFFCDDKAKVPFGDPDHLISMSIVPTTSTLSFLDHDMTRASITPSVLLNSKISGDLNSTFGKVTAVINDSAFQTTSPIQHDATITKMKSLQFWSNSLMGHWSTEYPWEC